MIYALDTNIISYMMKNDETVRNNQLVFIKNGGTCIIPLMAYYEIKRGLIAKNATTKMRIFEDLCSQLEIKKLTKNDMDTAALIYSNCKKAGTPIEDADLLIAAQCLTNGYTIVTANIKHFDIVDGLAIVDWTA
ncbi:MAG: PIN domain-containing protein [Firmicutes bacterium]|nr:PIN domain-containing protein [Bacillota bacterium]